MTDQKQDAKRKTARITLRMDDGLQARIMAQKRDNESLSSVCNRLLTASLDCAENPNTAKDSRPNADGEMETLRLSVTTLSEQLTHQGEQLSATLEQLNAALDQNSQLTSALKSAQETTQGILALQGISQVQKHLEDSGGTKKRGLWARFKATIKGDE